MAPPAQIGALRQAATALIGSAATPADPPPTAAAVEASQQRGSGCRWETWIGGKPAPERCGAETVPSKPWCPRNATRWQNSKKLIGRGHSLNAGASIRGALYGSGT